MNSGTQPPSPETFAETEAKRIDPGGFAATRLSQEFAPVFFESLGGYT